MNFKRLRWMFFSRPKNNMMKILAAVGIVGVSTLIFVKRDKIKEAADKIKEKLKKAG